MLPESLQDYPAARLVEDAVLHAKLDRGEVTLTITPERIVETCRTLKNQGAFIRLSDLTAVDRYPEEPRFEIVYHLHSLEHNQRIRLKCRVSEGIESVTPVWRSANWYEREVFDLFGTVFHHHPELERILLPAGWEGHPLRKDYPVTGKRV